MNSSPPSIDWELFQVRLYIIRGINISAKDENGLSDPVLEISLGRKRVFGSESIEALSCLFIDLFIFDFIFI